MMSEEAKKEAFELTLNGPGVEVTRELDEQQVVDVLAIVFGSAPEVARSSYGKPGASRRGPASPSIGEFMDQLTINNNADRIAAIVLYMKQQNGVTPVSKNEIPEWFQRAGEAPPKNLSRDLNKAVKAKLISEDHNKSGHYFITSTGESQLRSEAK